MNITRRPSPKVIQPDGNVALETILTERFGVAEFRPGQREAVMGLIQGEDVLIRMPTGGGKSLCYQLAGLMRGGLTIVVSPLIALMDDQVLSLRMRKLAAGALHTGLSRPQRDAILREAEEAGSYFLHISPERLSSETFVDWLVDQDVRLLVADEAHCISTWGHDFRPDYLRLHLLRRVFPQAPWAAVTATATEKTACNVSAVLQLRQPRRVDTSFDRPNLCLHVRNIQVYDQKLPELIKEIEASLPEKTLIYVGTRVLCQELFEVLHAKWPSAALYHGGMDGAARDLAQRHFTVGKTRLMIATQAFGMGLDVPDIRHVIHHQMPGSLEAYYQEVGRAGRDGAPAQATLLYHPSDQGLQKHFIYDAGATPDIDALKWQKLESMIRFAEDRHCRHRTLLDYFGDETPLPSRCGRCDVCSDV